MKIVAVLVSTAFLLAQPLPPKQDPRTIERRIEDIRGRLEKNSPSTPEQKELAGFVQRYLDEATRALQSGRRFQARCLADAADACRRPLDHLTGNRPAPPKPPDDMEDHLRQVYFRLRLSEYFLKQIPPPAPQRLLEIAREFYEKAVKAQQAASVATADEYAASADDLTHALESLAQAAVH